MEHERSEERRRDSPGSVRVDLTRPFLRVHRRPAGGSYGLPPMVRLVFAKPPEGGTNRIGRESGELPQVVEINNLPSGNTRMFSRPLMGECPPGRHWQPH